MPLDKGNKEKRKMSLINKNKRSGKMLEAKTNNEGKLDRTSEIERDVFVSRQ